MAKSATTTNGNGKKTAAEQGKREYVQQSLLPKRKLRDAMLIPQALIDNFGGKDAAPHQIAMAIGSSPTSSTWRHLTGAAIAYGLTEGGYNSAKISLTELGRRCVAPVADGEDVAAKNEAAMRPQILRQFFEKYDKNKFPDEKIAKNVLQHNFSVPADRCDEVLAIVKDNGAYVGVLHNTKTGLFVALNNPQPSASISVEPAEPPAVDDDEAADSPVIAEIKGTSAPVKQVETPAKPAETPPPAFKVFISHSKNMEVVEQVKEILGLYDINFELAVEEETTAIPVPDKVLDAMRRCTAGVMVVTADEQSKTGTEYTINNNVLIEIGAAFVLYNKRVVLLWDKRLRVPSNLQGLYRCEFEGNELSFAIGTKLAKSVKNFRHP
ncbi:MAG: nucleotide-binding protein [Phycisphaeraceae bacterium]|nr:MAG: nucleotide-binding protein [Phycisphaeraceae bacterium]